MVSFDSLIQDTKIFGKDYTQEYSIYDGDFSQIVLPQFIVEEITKSQDKVKVKFLQLHLLNYNNIYDDYSVGEDYSSFFYIPPNITEDVIDPGITEIMLGDWNLDGSVNILDAVMIINHIVYGGGDHSPYSLLAADVNQDSFVDILDVVEMVNSIVNLVDLGTIEV